MRSELADEDDMRELIVEFVMELPARSLQMRALTSPESREALRAMAHQLKGAGGGYGYPSITQAAARLEHVIVAQSSDTQVRESLETLISYCDAAVAGIVSDPAVTPAS